MKDVETNRLEKELMPCGSRHDYFVDCEGCNEALLDIEPIGVDQFHQLLKDSLSKPEPRLQSREEWHAEMDEVLPPVEDRAA